MRRRQRVFNRLAEYRPGRMRISAAPGLPRQLGFQEPNRSLPGELGCRRIIRVRSVLLKKPVLCPRICVERDVLPTGCTEDLLEILHHGGVFKFVRLSEMSEEGRPNLGIVAISRPVEEDDRSHVRGEFLCQPKSPKCAHGKANDSEGLSPHPRMDLKASHSALDLSAGCFLIEFRH